MKVVDVEGPKHTSNERRRRWLRREASAPERARRKVAAAVKETMMDVEIVSLG